MRCAHVVEDVRSRDFVKAETIGERPRLRTLVSKKRIPSISLCLLERESIAVLHRPQFGDTSRNKGRASRTASGTLKAVANAIRLIL